MSFWRGSNKYLVLVLEFRAAFELFDKDHSGAISKEELGTVMRNLGMNPTDEELHEQIQMHDADGRCLIFFPFPHIHQYPCHWKPDRRHDLERNL